MRYPETGSKTEWGDPGRLPRREAQQGRGSTWGAAVWPHLHQEQKPLLRVQGASWRTCWLPLRPPRALCCQPIGSRSITSHPPLARGGIGPRMQVPEPTTASSPPSSGPAPALLSSPWVASPPALMLMTDVVQLPTGFLQPGLPRELRVCRPLDILKAQPHPSFFLSFPSCSLTWVVLTHIGVAQV